MTLGFERESYSVQEDVGQVQVCVVLVGTGGTQVAVTVRVNSREDTATGQGLTYFTSPTPCMTCL